MIEFLIGVGVVWGSQVVWALTRRVRRPKVKEVEAYCGCEHHYSMHDPETGVCHATEHVRTSEGKPILDSFGNRVVAYQGATYESVQCGCRRYTGPEPLPSYYAPELSS